MRNTCHGCPHLQLHRVIVLGVMPSCGAVEEPFVVPHRSETDLDNMPEQVSDTEYTVTYWRVPEHCPLSDIEVFKSNNKARESDWKEETVRIGDLEEYTP